MDLASVLARQLRERGYGVAAYADADAAVRALLGSPLGFAALPASPGEFCAESSTGWAAVPGAHGQAVCYLNCRS